MVWTVRGDAINGNAETTDRMVTLSSRVETWRFWFSGSVRLRYQWWCLAHSTLSIFFNHLLLLFLQVQSWRLTSVNMPATCTHTPVHASGNIFYICMRSYKGDFHSNSRSIKKAPEWYLKDKSPFWRSPPSRELQAIATSSFLVPHRTYTFLTPVHCLPV